MKLLSGLTGNADKIGYLAAILGTRAGATDGGIQTIISSAQQALAGQLHMPNLQSLQYWAEEEGLPAIYAYIAGEVLGILPVGSIGKFKKPLQSGATSFAIGSLLIRLLYYSTHSEIVGHNIANNVSNAPTVQQAQAMYY